MRGILVQQKFQSNKLWGEELAFLGQILIGHSHCSGFETLQTTQNSCYDLKELLKVLPYFGFLEH